MEKSRLFRRLASGKEILIMPVVHDALCAKIAQKAGFKIIFMGGYSNSASLLGKPDVNLLTLTEMADCASRIVDAVDIPVFADGDTGHGNVTNVARTVRLFEKAGVAGIFIEDQAAPKRCGHMSGKKVIPAHEMVGKIKAALDARKDPDFVVMARTDAIAVHGIDDAIHRAKLYEKAGADMISVDAVETVEQMRRITGEIEIPKMVSVIHGGKTPILSAEEFKKIGYDIVLYTTCCT